MTSKPAFSYPVPHSTFIPISYESVTASGRTLKRKRTKSLATNASDNLEEEQEKEEAPNLQDGHDFGLRSLPASQGQVPTTAPWTPVNARTPVPALTANSGKVDKMLEESDGNGGDDNINDDGIFDGRRKRLASNLESRIRNAGYADDIIESLPPAQPTSLQAKHLSNINTLLHLCIIRRDWNRAKRAFRLLLLSDSEKDVKNLRLRTIWKLGVEILSWEYQLPADVERQQEIGDPEGVSAVKGTYAKTVEYMDRLVIMYPHYKHYVVGKGVNATTILPILMHFEILGLHEKLSAALNSGEVSVILEVLTGIESVTKRLKSLQESPPWVDMSNLWKLQGELYIWASDLSLRLLNDESGHLRYRMAGHKLSQRMKERGVEGWEEFVSEHDEIQIDDVAQF